MSKYITKEKYDMLLEAKEANEYMNHICSVKCKLGEIKQFEVQGTDLKLKMKCTQIGGMWTGSHCFVVC